MAVFNMKVQIYAIIWRKCSITISFIFTVSEQWDVMEVVQGMEAIKAPNVPHLARNEYGQTQFINKTFWILLAGIKYYLGYKKSLRSLKDCIARPVKINDCELDLCNLCHYGVLIEFQKRFTLHYHWNWVPM